MHVFRGGNEEPGRAAGWIADLVSQAWVHHLDHELDDVPGSAELAVLPGGGDLAEHVLVEVALDVAVLQGKLIQRVHCFHEQVRRRDGEPRVLHMVGVRRVVPAELSQPGEHSVGDDLVHLLRLQFAELRPAQRVGLRGVDRILYRLSVRLALCSFVVWIPSSRLMNIRYVICSMTSSGLEIPPDQKASHNRSILLRSSPVITLRSIVQAN